MHDKIRARPAAKATSLEIAHLAGVSQPTVSRALRGSPVVSTQTRERIRAIAQQLQYSVDHNASSLRTRQTHTLALLIFEDPTPDDSLINPFFHSMLGSITRACAERRYDLLISFQPRSPDRHSDREYESKADGIILLGYGDYLDYRPRLDALAASGVHFVRWGQSQEGQPGLSVGSDNFQGGYDATRHLLGCGRCRIAFAGDATSHYPEFLARYRGHCAALAAGGCAANPDLQVDALSTEESGHRAARELLRRGSPFDAVLAASDLIALGVMRALREHGLEVPREVSVVGFDDIAAASLASPALTTVMQDTRLAGEVLVDTLLRLISGEPMTDRVLPARLIVRGSSSTLRPVG
jgi:DNA-binding LacI/PurR family transcriptional regulator